MACGLLPADCIIEHWCRNLAGRKEPAGWRFECPVCGSQRELSVQVKGRYVAWNNKCQCDRAAVQEKLSIRLSGCISPGRRAKKPAPDSDELISLALADMSPQSLRLGLLEMAGLTTNQALDKLGVTRTNRYRVVSGLRQNRRSLGVSVSIHPDVSVSRHHRRSDGI